MGTEVEGRKAEPFFVLNLQRRRKNKGNHLGFGVRKGNRQCYGGNTTKVSVADMASITIITSLF